MSSAVEASAAAAPHEPSSPTIVAAHHDHHHLNALVADVHALHDSDIIFSPHRWHQEWVPLEQDLHDSHGENDGGDAKEVFLVRSVRSTRERELIVRSCRVILWSLVRRFI